MKLPDELLNEMHEFFLSYKRNEAGYEDYFSENRKSIKLLVDSAVEQLVDGVIGIKPKNSKHARLLINDALAGGELDLEMKSLCASLGEVLAQYWILETKDYIEYEEAIRDFIRGPLVKFCQVVAITPSIADTIPARRLAVIVGSIPDA
jgi:hypothetical protein